MLFTPQNKMAERKRKPNFSVDEVNVIVCMVEENNDVIRCKFTNTITNAKKEDVWKKITERVNAVRVCERSKDEVREKWRGLQTNAKKAHVKRKTEERRRRRNMFHIYISILNLIVALRHIEFTA